MNIMSTGIEALHRAEDRLQAVAEELARAGDPAHLEDTVDLSREMVAMIEARNEHAVNAKVIETAEEMQKHLLDVLG